MCLFCISFLHFASQRRSSSMHTEIAVKLFNDIKCKIDRRKPIFAVYSIMYINIFFTWLHHSVAIFTHQLLIYIPFIFCSDTPILFGSPLDLSVFYRICCYFWFSLYVCISRSLSFLAPALVSSAIHLAQLTQGGVERNVFIFI